MDIIANNLSAQNAKIYKKITVNGTDIKDYLSGQISVQVSDSLASTIKTDDSSYTELSSAPKINNNIVFVGNREFIYLTSDNNWHELGNEEADVKSDNVLSIVQENGYTTSAEVSAIISSYPLDTVTLLSNDEIISKQLSVITLSQQDYYDIVVNDRINLSTIYVINDSQLDAFEQTIINVAEPETSSDAATKNYVDTEISTFKENNGVFVISGDELLSRQLSVIKLSEDEYQAGVFDENLSSSILYIVDTKELNAYNMPIKNVADPIISSNAATKNYVDKEISKIDTYISSQISGLSSSTQLTNEFAKYQLSGNYLTAHQSLTAYYTKDQTNSLSTIFRNGLATTESLSAYQEKGTYLTSFSDALSDSYDLSEDGKLTKLITDIGRVLGATILNIPTLKNGENIEF